MVNGVPALPKLIVWGGEKIHLTPPQTVAERGFFAEQIPLQLLFEDEHLAIINKPAGLVVHPGSGVSHGTMLNALLHHIPELHGIPRAGIVHRLDKDTSGLLVVAKTLSAQQDLVRQLQARAMGREYLALVHGLISGPGWVDEPIGRHPTQRTKMAVATKGKAARTHYSIEKKYARHTLLRCRLDTGRTHQIRVHMQALGHPIVGDRTYTQGAPKAVLSQAIRKFGRQALHAERLKLIHPAAQNAMEWVAELPEDMRLLLEQIENV